MLIKTKLVSHSKQLVFSPFSNPCLLPFSLPSICCASLCSIAAESIWLRRLMCWLRRCTYKELSWPSEGWNHSLSLEILKTYGAPGVKRQREEEWSYEEGRPARGRENCSKFTTFFLVLENLEGNKKDKIFQKSSGSHPFTQLWRHGSTFDKENILVKVNEWGRDRMAWRSVLLMLQ